MESLKHLYLESCAHLKIKPDVKLLLGLEDAGTGESHTSLKLSSYQLNDEVCKAFGQALSKDVHLRELDFSDCMLSQEGIIEILHGIEKNKFLCTLNLKGNNIKSNGAEEIGRLLRHNCHLKQLCLEWNALGISDEKFSLLCEGITANTSLEVLDLRNNQLNHVCALSISDALVRNSTLLKLDVRWNGIGLIGGRALLKALNRNKTLNRIGVSGNNVPQEIEQAITIACSHNAEQMLARLEQQEMSKMLSEKLQNLEVEKKNQLQSLILQLEKKDQDLSESEKCSMIKLNHLKEVIKEKDEALQISNEECQELKRSLFVTSSQLNDLALRLNEVEIKNKDLKVEYQDSLAREKQEKEKMESTLFCQISTLKEENLLLKQQVQDLKTSQVNFEGQITKLTGTLSKLEKQSEMRENQFEEQMLSLKEKQAELLRENEEVKENQIVQMKKAFCDMEEKLKKQIFSLEQENTEIEKLLEAEKKARESGNTRYEEMLLEFKGKMKANEEKIKSVLEEKLELVETAKQKQEELLQEQLDVMYVLKKKITALNLDITEKNLNAQRMQQCLLEKDEEMKAAVDAVKLEAQDQGKELGKVKELLQLSSKENEELKNKFKEVEDTCKEEARMKDKIIESLKMEVSQREYEIQEIVDEQAHRNMQLQKALASYLQPEKKCLKLPVPKLEEEL